MRDNSRQLWIGIAILLLLLGANGYISSRALRRVAEENSRVQHTQQLLFETEHLKSLLVDAETGQRGYLYTGDRHYLDPYTEASREIDAQLDRVGALLAGDGEQMRRLTRVRQLAHQKLDELGKTIALDSSGHSADAKALVLTSIGKSTMDEIRHELSAIESAEGKTQSVRVERTARSTVAAAWTFAVATGIGAVSLVVFGIFLAHERKKSSAASKAVFEQKEWLHTTLHSIGDAVVATDSDGRVVFLNEVAVSLTGYRSDEAHGLPLSTVFPIYNETTRLPVENPVDKVIRVGTVVGLANHTVLRRRDGSEVAIDDSAAPIRNAAGDLTGVVLVFRDVTRQREVDSALRNAEKLATAGRFAATVAHEINNPLEAVMNSLYLLNQENALSPEGRYYLQMAEEELSRVAAVARQTLAFYKDTASPGVVNVPGLLEEILGVYVRRFQTRGVRVVRDYDDTAMYYGSAGELRQIFSNLILNALDAMPANGVLTLRVKQDGTQEQPAIQVQIEDNGEGIAPENLDKIFEPFFTTKKDVGTGLGLWSAKSLVEKSGGTLQARSANGSTLMIVSLPVAVESSLAQRAS